MRISDWSSDVCSSDLEASFDLAERYELGDEAEGLDISWAPTSNWFRAWTDAAVAARGLRIDSMTAKGRPQWNSAVLKRQQREGNEVAGRLDRKSTRLNSSH